MANPEHVEIVKAGWEAIDAWRKENPDERFDLTRADLSHANLTNANLSRADVSYANLSRADVSYANLSRADVTGADLSRADLTGAKLTDADLTGAKLTDAALTDARMTYARLTHTDLVGAKLTNAILTGASLADANLTGAHLGSATLDWANLARADLIGANLSYARLASANMSRADLTGTDLTYAIQDSTTFTFTSLADSRGLETCRHHGPSSIGNEVLANLQGNITPEIETFLRGCGLSPWEIECARLHDPALTANDISEIISTRLFDQRTEGPLYLGGCFISYSHDDAPFVDKLYRELQDAGAPVWLDRHDMVAGDMKRQVFDSIRVQDVVVLVLSKDSINSDWVETELKAARRKEKEQGRDVLCPVALDDTWEAKVKDNPTWGHLTDKLILDFSGWKTTKFEPQFEKLIKGMKINYTVPK